MWLHIAAFEWRYQRRSPAFWVGAILFFLLTFSATTVDTIQIGNRGNVNVNAPYAILQTLSVMSLFAIFVIISMVANVVIRDDETGFAPILRSTRVEKVSYLVGRFAGSVAAALCVMATIPLGILVGSLMPWLDPEKVGALRIGDYLYALFAFGLPTLLIISAGYFALATATRSMMWTYVGAVATIVLYLVMRGLLRDPKFDTIVGLADPFGVSALTLVTKYWTAAERNTQMPPLEGVLLANRALWSAIALALFGFAVHRFRFARPGKAMSAAAAVELADAPAPGVSARPLPAPRRDLATRWRQLWQLARFDMAFVFKSPAFFVLLVIGMINSGVSMWLTARWHGVGSYPVTRQMVQALEGAFTIMPIIIAVFYAGELVWRDRERKLHEIVDATAAPDWAHLVPKILAITLVLGATNLAAVVTGVVVQLLKGYTQFELGAYLLWFVVPTTILASQLAVLSVFVQVVVPQKFLGWGVMLLYVVATFALSAAGFEHHLYNFGDTTPVPLSDMNGMGRFWIGRAWLEAYWSAISLVLAVLAYGLWRRGTTSALRPRIARLGLRLRGTALGLLVIGVAASAAIGGFVYYNTNVLNPYQPAPDHDAWLARYEQTLYGFHDVPQPRITDVELEVQLYPHEARAVTHGRYQLQNRTSAPIGEIHVAYNENLTLDSLELAGATLARDWPEYHYRIYQLATPIQPGEHRQLRFATTLAELGFPNGKPLTRIVDNGTFLDNTELAPVLGVQREGLLRDRGKRRKYGLPLDLRPPTLEDERGRDHNPFRHDSDWVNAELTVTTDADQTPIAPGYTLSDTVSGNRRTIHTRTDAPVNHFFSVQSGRYAVKKATWNGVDLAVYYHPEHGYNVDGMLAAMQASLGLFSEIFSPYQFRQARILEFPSYATFAQSFANTIPYSEDIGFLADVRGPDTSNIITYVTAHEIAHQWWGHQLVPGDQQGATMLVESLAQYSALRVLERQQGPAQMRKFLKYELDRYLRSRGTEAVEELPLARVENQGYIHYQKGTLVFYWLRDVIGEQALDRVLAQLLRQYAFKPAPYPNTTDFLRLLRAEVGPAQDALITDLFEKITLVDAKATRAVAKLRPDGKYEVVIDVEAHKLYADGKGVETEAPLAEPFDIGAFTVHPGDPAFAAPAVLYLQHQPIKTGPQTVTIVVDKLPAFAGIDPYNKRIDRNSDDNLVPVELQPPSSASARR
ncbi:MAG TPA: M1 family aminopeptidase [Kofleriaceae bacterium]